MLEGLQMDNIKLGIVVSDYNKGITSKMLEIALTYAQKKKITISHTIHVPGAFDTPLAIKKLLQKKDVDGVAVLGTVLKGGTDHDQIVAHNAARCAADLSLQFNKPVALGISGPNMTRKQAKDRIKGYAERAIETAVTMVDILKQIE